MGLKESLSYLEGINKLFHAEITKLRKSKGTCETCVSLIKEINDLHKTLSKFTQGEEKLNLNLSSQRPSLNKDGLGFKKERNPSKDIDHKKKKLPIYKCTHCKRVGHLEPFCFNKLKISKGNNLRSSVTNSPRPKKMWGPKMKP